MGLIEDLNDKDNFVHSSKGKCTFCTLLETLPKEEVKAIANRVDDKNITSASLSRVLRKNGFNLSEGVVSRHRRKACDGFKR